jgi:hypothetical protein
MSTNTPRPTPTPTPGPKPQPLPTPTPPPPDKDVQKRAVPATPKPEVRLGAGAATTTPAGAATPPPTPVAVAASGTGSKLSLGINERYRAAIELAAQRTGLDPAAIAAVINAEAGPVESRATRMHLADAALSASHPDRDFKKQPLDGKDPKDAELIREWKALYAGSAWDETSHNAQSGAAGLTQFLDSTWRGEALRSGTYLNQIALEKGYVKDGHVVSGKDADLLKLRYDPTTSIVAGAEYDKSVFDRLSSETVKSSSEADRVFVANHPDRDFKAHPLSNTDPKDAKLRDEWKAIYAAQPGTPLIPKDLTDDQKARYIYVGHHEGELGAKRILEGTLTDKQAHPLLVANVPDDQSRAALVKEHGGESQAYQSWLWGYVDGHIVPGNFRN